MVSRLSTVTTIPSPAAGMRELGEYLRQQRIAANLSVRQLSAVTGISNPYLSQIERGLRRPSAEILQQLAQGLSLSAESLYVRAGLLDPDHAPHGADARVAIRNDPRLDGPQRRALLDAYSRIVEDGWYAVVDAPAELATGASVPDGNKPSYHHGSKEMYMNAKSATPHESDRDAEKSALTPIYAVVGASDLAVEKLVELGHRAAKDAEQGIDELQQRADDLQLKANRDVSKAIKGAKHLPKEAVKQAKKAVAKGRQQYADLARRGKDVDLAAQASTTAQGLMKQAGDLAGRSRKEAGQAVDKKVHQATSLVEQGKHEAEARVAKGRHQAEHVVAQGRQQAEKRVAEGRRVVEQVGHEAEKRVADGRRAAERTRRAAAHQADKVVDQASHVVEAVSHGARHPMSTAKTVGAEVRKPIARRRRSPGAPTAETRPVMSAGVDAGATTPTAKAPAAKKATAKKAATKKAAAKPAVKRASSTPVAGAAKRTTKRAAKPVTATPADMPATPAVTPVIAEPALPDTPSDHLPASSGE